MTDDTRSAFEAVQRIFRDYVEGADGGMRIAERLTREGIQPPARADIDRAYAPGCWRPKHIQNILTSRTYLGHMVHDGTIVARDVHEAAVDEETFERVQAAVLGIDAISADFMQQQLNAHPLYDSVGGG